MATRGDQRLAPLPSHTGSVARCDLLDTVVDTASLETPIVRTLRAHDAALRGPYRDLRPRAQATLRHDVLYVYFSRAFCDHQPLSDRAVAKSGGEKRGYFPFSILSTI